MRKLVFDRTKKVLSIGHICTRSGPDQVTSARNHRANATPTPCIPQGNRLCIISGSYCLSASLSFLSFSMTCFDQLFQSVSVPANKSARRIKHLLPAGIESVKCWELCSRLSFGAEVPRCSCDTDNDGPHSECICLPILRLAVPSTGR